MLRRLIPVAALLALISLTAGCQAELGERCDGFFSNGCRSPASCVETESGSYCAGSCSMGTCPAGFECVMATVNDLPAGEVCLPVSGG